MDVVLPDGTTLTDVPEGTTQSEILRRLKAGGFDTVSMGLEARRPEGESGFVPALKAGFESLKGEAALLAGKTGLMEPAKAQAFAEEQKQKAAETFKPTETWSEAPVRKFLETLGGSLPYMAAPLGAGLAVAATPLTGTAALATGLGAAGLASAAQFTGSNIARQMEAGKTLEEASLPAAAGAALPQAALDLVGFRATPLIKRLFTSVGKEISEDAAKDLAVQSFRKTAQDYALSTGTAMGVEGATESAQQLLERLQAGLSLTDAKAREEYLESFVGGAVLGGAFAVPGRYIERQKEIAQAEQMNLAPGQLPGESLEQTANRLQREVLALRPEEEEKGILTNTELAEMASKPDGYGQLIQYREGLKNLPSSPERSEAFNAIQAFTKELESRESKVAVQAQKPELTEEEFFAKRPGVEPEPYKFKDVNELVDIVRQAQGPKEALTSLLSYMDEVKAQPKSKEREDALNLTRQLYDTIQTESLGRQIPEREPFPLRPIDLDKAGISRKDPLFNTLKNKSLTNPDEATVVVKALEDALKKEGITEVQQTKVSGLLESVENYLRTEVPGSGFYAERTIPKAGRKGVGVADTGGEPSTTEGVVTPKRPRVVRPAEDVGPPVPRETKPKPALTERQERIEFGKGIGAAQPYPGMLYGRTNLPAQKAAIAGDFQSVVNALEKSKNATVREIANRAKALKTKIVIDEEASEIYEVEYEAILQYSIDSAKMHLAALDKIRSLYPKIEALPNKSPLPNEVFKRDLPVFSNGKEGLFKINLESIAKSKTTFFAPIDLGENPKLENKEDFIKLRDEFERITKELGEEKIRMTASASSKRIGVTGVYDVGSDTIRIPEYWSKKEDVLAHEIVHAQAAKAIAMPNIRQKPVVQRLDKLYNNVKKILEEQKDKSYGLTNLQEFVAEGLSNPDFQFKLNKIEYENKSAWSKFVQAIADLIGVKNNTAFTELLSLYEKLVPAPKRSLKEVAAKVPEAKFRELESKAKAPEKPKAPVEKEPTELEIKRAEKLEQLRGVLSRILKKYNLKDVEVRMVEDLEAGTAEASYANKLIQFATDNPNPVRVLRHEVIHALKELGFFTDAQWKVLTDRAKKEWVNTYLKNRNINGQDLKPGEKSRYDAYMELYNGDQEVIIEEAIADAFASFTKPPVGMMRAIYNRINNLFKAIKEAMGKQGYTAEDIFEQAEKGKLEGKAAAEPSVAKASLRAPQTKEFKEWFKNSKIVDDKGNPLPVYHGTKREFSAFRAKYPDALLFFTINPEFANKWIVGFGPKGDLREPPAGTDEEYKKIKQVESSLYSKYMKDPEDYDFKTQEGTDQFDSDRKKLKEAVKKETGFSSSVEFESHAGNRIIPVFLSIQKPFDATKDYKVIESFLKSQGLGELVDRGYHKTGNWLVYENKPVIDELKRLGYDGIWISEDTNGPQETIAAFYDKQIKSAIGNVGAYGQRPITEAEAKELGMTKEEAAKAQEEGDIRFSLRDKLGMYSELERKVAESKQASAPASQWKGMIKSMPGVKQDEIEWSGVNDWLDLQTGKVNKEDLLDYLHKGGVQVEETVLGGREPFDAERLKQLESEFKKLKQHPIDDPSFGEEKYNEMIRLMNIRDQSTTYSLYEAAEQATRSAQRAQRQGNNATAEKYFREAELLNTRAEKLDLQGQGISKPPKYGQYTLPGGTNYREVLLTLPSDSMNTNQIAQKLFGKEMRFLSESEKDQVVQESRRLFENRTDYRSSHWDQPNVLAHLRLNDRTDADGNKVLFVEEIQSDWGQEGKKKGFIKGLSSAEDSELDALLEIPSWERTTAQTQRVYELINNAVADTGVGRVPVAPFISSRQFVVFKDGKELVTQNKEGKDVRHRYDNLEAAQAAAKKFNGEVRDMGMQANTEGWLNLALKRIMVMAAEGDYDKVAFINGDQSADRYKLSKQVDEVHWRTLYGGEKNLTTDLKNGDSLTFSFDDKGTISYVSGAAQSNFVGKRLDEVIGKDLAERVMSEPSGVVSGEGLDIGGIGMKTFYDKIVPNTLKKLLPKVGGGQMTTVEMERGKPSRAPSEATSFLDWMGRAYPEIKRVDAARAWSMGIDNNSYVQEYFDTIKSMQQSGFDVTDSMKGKVAEGLPRFSLRTIDPDIQSRIEETIAQKYEPTPAERISKAFEPESFSKFRQAFLNRYNQLAVLDKRVARQLKAMGGPEQLADSKAETAALFSDHGAGLLASAMGIHDRIGGVPVFKNGVTVISNLDGKVKGPLAIFSPLAKFGPEGFRAYQFWAGVQRGKRLMYEQYTDKDGKTQYRVRERLFTKEDIEKADRLLQTYPEFKNIQKEWIKYNDGLVKFMVDTGILTPEKAKAFTEHGDYFPFYRQVAEEDALGPKVFSSIANVKPPKALKGGEDPLGDFFENIVRNSQAAITAGIKNVAAQRATKQALLLGEVQKLDTPQSGPNIYRVLEKGKDVYYAANDPLFINAIKALNIPDLPFIGLLSKPAEVLRNLVTKDPAFMLANMMRDSLSAWTTSGVKMTPIASTLINFGKAIGNKSPELHALQMAGIIGGYDYSRGTKATAKEFAKELRKMGEAQTKAEKALKPFSSLWGALEKGTEASDAATRMEIYKKVLAQTGNEAEALWQAMEVMNFSRKGSSPVVRVLTAAVPFLNARMQGLDVLYRAAINPMFDKNATEQDKARMKTFWVRGMTIMALSAMYWAMTHDDDDYKKQEQETRDNYWLIPSMGIKLPIPFEVGVMFKVIPERILQYSFGDDTGKDFLKSMGRQLTSTFAFNPIPQTVLPIIEAATNYSFFTQRPIVGQGMAEIAPGYQVGPNTSRIAGTIGEALGISPIKLDHMIQGYTGTMGMYFVNALDAFFDMNSESPKASKRFEQMPVLRRFLVDPEARGTVTAYYDLKNSVDEVVRTSNYLQRTMDLEGYGEYMQDNIRMFATRSYVNDLEKTMKDFREMKNLVRISKMDADAKRDALTNIGRLENQLTANIQQIKKFAQ